MNANNIFVTGSPVSEVLKVNMEKINESSILKKLGIIKDKYFLISIHREENVDNIKNLTIIMKTLDLIARKYKYPLIVTTHPRTKKRLDEANIAQNNLIQFHKPFGIFDFVKLQKNAYCVLSDSGTINEDAGIMGIHALVIRESSERPEAFDTGNVIITGINPQTMLSSIEILKEQCDENIKFSNPVDYQPQNVSDKVVRLIVGMSKLVPKKKYYL